MNIKLFENFEESPSFTQSISAQDCVLDLFDEPYGLSRGRVLGGTVTWSCELDYGKRGIDLRSFSIISLKFELEIEDEDGEEVEVKIIEIPKSDLGLKNNLSYSVEGFPLTISSIDLMMRHTEDTDFWKYKVILGAESIY